MPRGEVGRPRQFLDARPRDVSAVDPDAQRALGQALLQPGDDAFALVAGRNIVLPRRIPVGLLEIGQVGLRFSDLGAQLRDAGEGPRRRRAVVDGAAGAGLQVVPVADRQDSGLEFQRRGDSVERLDPIAGQRLSVAVQVDETWCHDEPAGIENLVPGEIAL